MVVHVDTTRKLSKVGVGEGSLWLNLSGRKLTTVVVVLDASVGKEGGEAGLTLLGNGGKHPRRISNDDDVLSMSKEKPWKIGDRGIHMTDLHHGRREGRPFKPCKGLL